MADNGVQDKENKEEVHFPQTWEEADMRGFFF